MIDHSSIMSHNHHRSQGTDINYIVTPASSKCLSTPILEVSFNRVRPTTNRWSGWFSLTSTMQEFVEWPCWVIAIITSSIAMIQHSMMMVITWTEWWRLVYSNVDSERPRNINRDNNIRVSQKGDAGVLTTATSTCDYQLQLQESPKS